MARPKYRDVLRAGGSDAKQRRRPPVDEDQQPVGKVIVAEMPKADKMGAFDVYSLERGTDRRPAGRPVAVFCVSYIPHDRLPSRKAPMARMCPALVAANGKNTAETVKDCFGQKQRKHEGCLYNGDRRSVAS